MNAPIRLGTLGVMMAMLALASFSISATAAVFVARALQGFSGGDASQMANILGASLLVVVFGLLFFMFVRETILMARRGGSR